MVILVIQGLLPVVTVYLTRNVVNALVVVIDSNGDPAALIPAVTTIVLMGSVMLISGVLGSVNSYIRTVLGEQVRGKMYSMIHAKALTLDMQFFESPTYYDQLQRASIDAIDRPMGLLDSISKLLQNTITLVAMAGVLLTFAWWLPIACWWARCRRSGWRCARPGSSISGGCATRSTSAGWSTITAP